MKRGTSNHSIEAAAGKLGVLKGVVDDHDLACAEPVRQRPGQRLVRLDRGDGRTHLNQTVRDKPCRRAHLHHMRIRPDAGTGDDLVRPVRILQTPTLVSVGAGPVQCSAFLPVNVLRRAPPQPSPHEYPTTTNTGPTRCGCPRTTSE